MSQRLSILITLRLKEKPRLTSSWPLSLPPDSSWSPSRPNSASRRKTSKAATTAPGAPTTLAEMLDRGNRRFGTPVGVVPAPPTEAPAPPKVSSVPALARPASLRHPALLPSSWNRRQRAARSDGGAKQKGERTTERQITGRFLLAAQLATVTVATGCCCGSRSHSTPLTMVGCARKRTSPAPFLPARVPTSTPPRCRVGCAAFRRPLQGSLRQLARYPTRGRRARSR